MADDETPTPKANTFETITADEAIEIIETSLPDEAEANQLFMEGDHWQEGEGWIGPVPPDDDSDYDITLDLIETGFTSRNVIREIVQRRTRGVVGSEPRFGVAPRQALPPGEEPTDAQTRAQGEIEAALTEWWDRRKVHEIIQRAVSNASWSTKGPVRIFVPSGKLQNNALPRVADLPRALSLIYVEAPDPENATVAEDEETKDEIGILQTEIDENTTRVELYFLGPETTNGERVTTIRVIEQSKDGTATEEEFSLPLGGRILLSEIRSELLITKQQQQLQKALNLTLTMIPHSIVTGGFLERTILNGLPPGHWETAPDGSRGKRFIREPYVTGPGVTSWVRGLEMPQKDGSIQLTTPDVRYREPSDPEFANKAKRSLYQDMLEEADQPHVLISGDATASGRSREQARADFMLSLTQLEAPTNGVGRWIIETVLAIAELAMQTPGAFLDEWRGQFECRLNTGPISIEERAQNLAEVNANLLSRDTAMERNGVADVEAERGRIATQTDSELATLERRATVFASLVNAGADIEGAADVAGIEDGSNLVPQDVPPEPDPNAQPPAGGPPAP